jgi:hypothetical protein
MQQKTDGRVVRLLTKHLSAEDRSVEQWFLVAIGDDDKAKGAVAKTIDASEQVVEIVGHIPATTLQLGDDGRRGSARSSWGAHKWVTSLMASKKHAELFATSNSRVLPPQTRGYYVLTRACTHKPTSQMLTWMRRPTSVIGRKADMART